MIAVDRTRSAGGFTLFAPQTDGGKVYLIDLEGTVVHSWQLPYRPGRDAVLLPNGNLGYNGNHPDSPDLYPAWSLWHGGAFFEVTPDGKVVWEYVIPYFGEYPEASARRYVSGYHNSVFRSHRYAKSEIPWL